MASKSKIAQYNRLRQLYPGLPTEFNAASVEVLMSLALDTKIKYDRLLNE